MSAKNSQTAATPFWRDERVLQIFGQVVFVLLVGLFFYSIARNMVTGLARQGMALGFDFLKGMSGFDIGEMLIEYSRSSTYGRALLVGLVNTLMVSLLGIIFSTILGIILGVARLSTNYLVNKIAAFYLEVMRNLALLVFLIFWYLGVFLKLPRVKDAIVWPGNILLTNRGVGVPWGIPTETFGTYRLFLLGGLVLASAVAVILHYRGLRTGRPPLTTLWFFVTWIGAAVIGWIALPSAPLALDLPYVKGLNLAGGRILSPEFMALFSGLTLYTAAFIGEVVRAGIQAVSKGQVEASRALGLSGFQTLRLVVFPQALRVIVPPLTSQYLNLTKNSSLAVAIGFPDFFYVSSTVINQSGRAVEMISLVMLVYLSTSLLTSLFMNWYNQKIRLVER
ncbi:MAG: ABC transporter permease subunit [Chloroflexota bacterium]